MYSGTLLPDYGVQQVCTDIELFFLKGSESGQIRLLTLSFVKDIGLLNNNVWKTKSV